MLLPINDTQFLEVLVWYTDGIEELKWGGICGDTAGNTATVGTVICRQLGREYREFKKEV